MRQDIGTQSLNDDSDPGGKEPFLCRMVGHHRSGQLAFNAGDGIWRSRCKRCGTAMVRIRHRRWVPVTEIGQTD